MIISNISTDPTRLLYEKVSKIAPKSVDILMSIIDFKLQLPVPIPNTNNAIKDISECLIIDNPEDNFNLTKISIIYEMSFLELNSLILYDLAIYSFFVKNYTECIKFAINSIEYHNMVLKPANTHDFELLESYMHLSHSVIDRKKIITKDQNKEILDDVLNEFVKTSLVPSYFFLNTPTCYESEAEIATFIQDHLKPLNTESDAYKIAILILRFNRFKLIHSYIIIQKPQHSKLISELLGFNFSKHEEPWSGWDSVPLSFLSLEQDLLNSHSFQHIQSTLSQLHIMQPNFSYAKRNLLYITLLEPFISTIEDPFLFDLTNVVFAKIQQYKLIKDFKNTREMLKSFYEYINTIIRPDMSVTNRRLSSVMGQCRQFVANFPTGSFTQHQTLICAIAELCNIPDFPFFASLANTQTDPQSFIRVAIFHLLSLPFCYLLLGIQSTIKQFFLMRQMIYGLCVLSVIKRLKWNLPIHLSLDPVKRTFVSFTVKNISKCACSDRYNREVNPSFIKSKQDFRKSLILYISLMINLKDLNIDGDLLVWWIKVLKNMVICCGKIGRYDHALLVHNMLPIPDFEVSKLIIDSAFENNQNVIENIQLITHIDILEYISELYCSAQAPDPLTKINVRIKGLINDIRLQHVYQIDYHILEILMNNYLID
ncbi:hypothetical protein MXB_5569 [Myxobolus squamalis]|nr:hypothetical protein MXB_5569 [Myxobolus squamalis]